MRIEEKEVIIPAKTYIERKYIASDGTEFVSENSCLSYEKNLEIKKHPVYASAIENIYTFDEEYRATLYYFSNEEDYKFFLNSKNLKENKVDMYNCRHNLVSDFEDYGAGWYICWNYSWGDYSDTYYIRNHNNYINEFEKEWQCYKDSLKKVISEKEEEMKE